MRSLDRREALGGGDEADEREAFRARLAQSVECVNRS
jgi:hypothetical protein